MKNCLGILGREEYANWIYDVCIFKEKKNIVIMVNMGSL